jgi:hypothetical protein
MQMFGLSAYTETQRARLLHVYELPDGKVQYYKAAVDGALPLTAPGLGYTVLAVRLLVTGAASCIHVSKRGAPHNLPAQNAQIHTRRATYCTQRAQVQA